MAAWKVPAVLGGCFVVVLVGGSWWAGLLSDRTARPSPDKLCQYISDKHGLECPVGLGSDDVYAPGSIVRLETSSEGKGRVSWPSGTLLGAACLLPGTDAEDLRLAAAHRRGAALETVTYDVNASLVAGGDLHIPTLQGLTLRVGPEWKKLRQVSIAARDAQFRLLDENNLAQSLSSCSLRTSCVKRILENQDRVVNGVLVAEGLQYRFIGAAGRSIPISAGIRDGVLGVSLEGKPVGADAFSETLDAKTPIVMGVTLVRENVLRLTTPCMAEAVVKVEGDSRVRLAGGGKRHFISERQANAKFTEPIEVKASGSESSECRAGGHTVSGASASARVTPDGDNGLRFDASVRAQGGHFRTVSACVAGRAFGLTGHDNNASASALLNGLMRFLVRSEKKARIVITWSGFIDSSRLSVSDPRGHRLIDAEDIRGDGQRALHTTEAGVYLIRASTDVTLNRGGAQSGTAAMKGVLSARLEPLPDVTSR